jgi:hypothetical protein
LDYFKVIILAIKDKITQEVEFTKENDRVFLVDKENYKHKQHFPMVETMKDEILADKCNQKHH